MITLEEIIGTLKVHEDKIKAHSIKKEEKAFLAKAFIKDKKRNLDSLSSRGCG